MALDFPNLPVDGQVFNAPNGVSYRFSASVAAWIAAGGGSGIALPMAPVDVRLFGAKCDSNSTGSVGTIDTAAIQAAINSLSPGGGVLIPGWSKVDAALVIPASGITIMGLNPISCGVITTNPTAHIFAANPDLTGTQFMSLGVWSTVTKTAGAAFDLPRSARVTFFDVIAGDLTQKALGGNRLWRGIDFRGTNFSNLLGCRFAGYQQEAIRAYGDGPYAGDLAVDRFTLISDSDIGIHICGGFNALIGDPNIVSCRRDVVLDKSVVNTRNAQCLFGAAILDICNDTCLYIDDDSVEDVNIGNSWIASAGKFGTPSGQQSCIWTHVNNPNLSITGAGARIKNAGANGITLNGGRLTLGGCEITQHAGFAVVTGPSTGPINISGGQMLGNGNATTGGDLSFGAPSFSVRGTTLGSARPVQLTGVLGPSRVIKDCNGYVTEANGIAQINAGATSVVVDHGLAGAPLSMRATPTAPGGAGAWVDTPTATTFTIHLSAAPAANVTFDWFATVNAVA